MRILLVFGLLFMSMISTARAQNCSNVDFSEDLGDPRSQGDIGWCYANAAADLLSYKYRDELKGEKVSAIYMALLYNKTYYTDVQKKVGPKISKFFKQNVSDGIGEGGFMSLAIHSALKKGFCPKNLDDQLARHSNSDLSLQKKLEKGLSIKIAFDKAQKKYKKGWALGAEPIIKEIREKDNILDDVDNERLYEILRTTTTETFLVTLGDELCKEEKYFPKKYYLTNWRVAFNKPKDNWYLFNEIDRQLNQKNPIGVMYYMTFFGGWNKGVDLADAHASVIVGRRWLSAGTVLASGEVLSKGRCEYKLRNSWGKYSCNSNNYANPDFTSLSSSSPQNAVAGCEKGHIWIDREKYKNYLYGVTYIGTQETSPPKGSLPSIKDLVRSIIDIPFFSK